MVKLWAYEDAHRWGEMLAQAALARGHDVHLFEDPRVPDRGFVFMHMNHHPQVRLLHKRVMAVMSVNPELALIPDYRASALFDDKIEQARQLSRWTPRTRIFYSPNPARQFIATDPFPFISKSSEGADSRNVRYVETLEQARSEIRSAFSDVGIKAHYGQQQIGYLLWQDFIAGNAGDIRIIAIGSKRLVLRRGNRPNRPMASGSGKLFPVTKLDAELESALEHANKFFEAESFKWCAIDLVKNASGRWFILEAAVSWQLHNYYECEFIDGLTGEPTGRLGSEVWQVLVDEIEAGVFNAA